MLQMEERQTQKAVKHFHFHSPLPSLEMSHHKTIYKQKPKHQSLKKVQQSQKPPKNTNNKESVN